MIKAVRVLALLGMLLPAVARAQGNNEFAVERAAQPPRIDGVLDDAVWSRAPLAIPADGWVSYNPNRGDKMPADFSTEVRIAYDDRNIYFAFHCFDNEPDKIRTNVAQARRRVQRRLDRDEPGFRRHRPDRVSPVLESEREPDGRAQHVRVRRAVRRRHGLVQRREDDRATAMSSKCRSRCRRCASPAATK